MSVARREWKSEAELRAWITHGARVTALAHDRDPLPDLVIIHQPPRSGRANWRVIDRRREHGGGVSWSVATRSVITRAQLQFDLR